MPKDIRITIRLSPQLAADLEAACKLTGLDVSTVSRACLEAYVEHVKRHREIRLPLAIAAKSELLKSVAVETAPHPVRYSRTKAR
ncbi:MAG: hypothetical protein WCH57_02705 [Verrucomicrobiota bacterium]